MPLGRRAAALALLGGGLAACFSDRPTAPELPAGGGDSVAVRNFAYVPPTLTVAAGTVVTWTNEDNVSHTVTSDDGTSFASPTFVQGKSYQLTAPAAGTYPYHCAIHPFMKGTLTVTAP